LGIKLKSPTILQGVIEVERTFVYLKPDAIYRGLIGEIIHRFENKGLKIVALKMMRMTREKAEELYREHKGKSFFENLMNFISDEPVVVMILEGPKAVEMVRHVVGATDPLEAAPGSIRGDYGASVTKNLIHASDSHESAEREMGIFFEPSEIVDYELEIQRHLIVG